MLGLRYSPSSFWNTAGGGSGGAFTPAALNPDLWIEARSGTFQSNAGTTAAAADSDPVGFITDLSGNGFNLSSVADDTTRPLLQGTGDFPYLDFDGSDDVLRRAAALGLYASTSGLSVFAAVRGNPATSAVLFSEGWLSGANPRALYLRANGTTASVQSPFYANNDATTMLNSGTGGTGAYDNTDNVVGVVDTTAAVTQYVEGSAGSAISYTRSGTTTLNVTSLGALVRSITGNWFAGRVYGLVAVRRVLNAGEISALNTYLTGLYS